MTVKYFNVKNGLTSGAITLDATSGNTTTTNLSVTGETNLGSIANVIITGGSSGYVLSTDGAGNLSFADLAATQSPAPMPTLVNVGDTLTISANYQGIFGYPITIDGTLDVEGVLVDVNDAVVPAGVAGSVQYNDNGTHLGGDNNFTYSAASGKLTVTIVKTTPTIAALLPSAASAGAGARAFVTDATSTTFNAALVGGGGNSMPVFSNGSGWFIG